MKRDIAQLEKKAAQHEKRLKRQNEYNKDNYIRYTVLVRKDSGIDLKEIARQKGFSSVSAYLLHLIEKDLKTD